MTKKIMFLIGASLISGCSTMERSTLLGSGIGGAIGTGTGSLAGQNAGSALLGLGIGAIVGGGFGYLTHKDNEEKKLVLKALQGRKDMGQEVPTLLAPKASCYKTGEKVEGDEYYGPQIRCRIDKQAVWGR